MPTSLAVLHSSLLLRTMAATNARWSTRELTEAVNLGIDASYPVWKLENIQFISTTSGQQFYPLHSNFRELVSVKTGFSNYPPVEMFGCAIAQSAPGPYRASNNHGQTHALMTPYVLPVGRRLQVEYQGLHPRLGTFTDETPVPDAFVLAYAEARLHQMWTNAGPPEDQETHFLLMQQCDAEATALKAQMQERQKAQHEIRIEQIKAGKRRK